MQSEESRLALDERVIKTEIPEAHFCALQICVHASCNTRTLAAGLFEKINPVRLLYAEKVDLKWACVSV